MSDPASDYAEQLSTRQAAWLGITVPGLALAGFATAFAFGLIPGIWWANQNSGNEDAWTIMLATIGLVSLGVYTVSCILVAVYFWRREPFGAWATVALALWVCAGFAAAALVEPFAANGGYGALVPIVGVLVSVGMFLLWMSLASNQHRQATVIALAVVAVIAGGAAIGAANETAHDIATLERGAHPLALVDHDQLSEVLPGWSVESYNYPAPTVQILTASDVTVKIRLHAYDARCDERWNTCVPLAPLTNGSPVVGEIMDHGCSGTLQGTTLDAIVTRPDGGWTASVRRESCTELSAYPTLEELVILVETLEPATAEEWVAAAASD